MCSYSHSFSNRAATSSRPLPEQDARGNRLDEPAAVQAAGDRPHDHRVHRPLQDAFRCALAQSVLDQHFRETVRGVLKAELFSTNLVLISRRRCIYSYFL